MSLTILHGPGLATIKPQLGIKRRPCTWPVTTKMQAQTVDAIERLARLNGCQRSDIVRTAVTEFLTKYAEPAQVNHLTDQTPSQTITQPHTARPYTGNGGSDRSNINAARDRQNARSANPSKTGKGSVGERLIDKSVVR